MIILKPIEENTRRNTVTLIQLCYRILFFFFVITLICRIPSFGEQNDSEKRVSLEFKNASISDILDELTIITGIDISANKIPEDSRVTKSYRNLTIEQIVRDLFKSTSFALIWNYGHSGVHSLDIKVFDGGGSTPRSFSTVERQASRNPVRPARPPRIKPKAQDESDDLEKPDEKVEEDEPAKSKEFSQSEPVERDDETGKGPLVEKDASQIATPEDEDIEKPNSGRE